MLAAGTELGTLGVTATRPSWTRLPGRPFDRAVSIRIANNGVFKAHRKAQTACDCGAP